MRKRRQSKLKRFRKARRNGTLPGRPKTGRPPGVPLTKNPLGWAEVGNFVLPAFGGFAATRASSRITAAAIARKWPRAAKHAGVIAAGLGFLVSVFGAHRIKALARYHMPIVVGSGIAVIQSAVQTYLPKYGWLVGHPAEDVQQLGSGNGAAASSPVNQIPTGDDVDDGWFNYNDAFDAGRYSEALPSQQQRAEATPGSDAMEDLLDELDPSGGDMGIFN